MADLENTLSIQNIALLNDIVRLPKNILEGVCTDIGLPTDGTVEELTSNLWEKIKNDKNLQNTALEGCKNRILGGRTSIMWYTLTSGATLSNSKEIIIKALGWNPFTSLKIPSASQLTSAPVVFSATNGDADEEYYLRFIYKTRNVRNFFGASMESITRSSIGTIYVNEKKSCIEVRADNKNAPKLAAAFAKLVNQKITVEPCNFANKFGCNVEKIAEVLNNGTLMGASSKPELTLDDFTEDQASAVVHVLSSIECFFEDEDIDQLKIKLLECRDTFGGILVGTSFLPCILSGLGKVGLDVQGTEKDLRAAPLYEALKPFLKNQEGYIRFKVDEDGLMTEYTIRVGLTTNSIFFVSPATENAIRCVREHVIL